MTMRGFSLLEIMLTLFIMALLTALSVPVYSSYFMHQHRLAAETSLFKLATQLEKFYLQHDSYDKATLAELGFSTKTADQSYLLNIAKADNVRFELQAIPEGRQAKELICGTLTLSSQGEKGMTGKGAVKDCWG
jgi:type IV pilus assembly protein PilE